MSKYSEKRYKYNCEQTQIIINHCFNGIIGNFVKIGEWTNADVLLSKTILLDSKPTYLFDANNVNFLNYIKNDKVNRMIHDIKVYPSSNVTIVVSSKNTLTKILSDFKESIWWNHEAHFLIINDDQEIGCSVARQFLHIIWNFNILSAIYICFNNKNQVIMPTFNPYDRSGTTFWRVAWVKDAADDYWTMFEHVFDNSFYLNSSSLNCNDLNLRRTKNLNALNIRMGTHAQKVLTLSGKKTERLNDIAIIQVILDKLNATYTFKDYREFGYFIKTVPQSYRKDIETGTISIVTTLVFCSSYNTLNTYPFEFHAICFVTPKNTDILYVTSSTENEKIVFFLAFLVSIIVIKYVFRQSISSAILEYVRMLTGSAFLKKTSRTRDMFLVINIIFVIYLSSTFVQIRLTTFKTIPNKAKQIDTVEELINSNLVIGGSIVLQKYVFNEKILKKFIVENSIFDCVKDIFDGKKKACLLYCQLKKEAELSDYGHQVTEPMTIRPSAFLVSPDWPLLSEFNLILSYMVQSGIYQFKSAAYEAAEVGLTRNYLDVQPTKLKELWLCFYLLFGGCSLATIILLIECCIYRINNILRPPVVSLKKGVITPFVN